MQMGFDTDAITRIIEVCSRSGVAKFSYGGLELSFLQVDKAPVTEPIFVQPEVRALQDSQARDSITREEVSLREAQLEQLQIDDPEEYENLLRTRDLEIDEEARP